LNIYFPKRRVQIAEGFFLDPVWHVIGSFDDTPRDSGKGVAVAAERNEVR
jgi:hypothetical protein